MDAKTISDYSLSILQFVGIALRECAFLTFRELHDTVEDERRTLRIPPALPVDDVVRKFQVAKSRLLIVVSFMLEF